MEVRHYGNSPTTIKETSKSVTKTKKSTTTTKKKTLLSTKKAADKVQDKKQSIDLKMSRDDLDEMLNAKQPEFNARGHEDMDSMLKAFDPHTVAKEKAAKEIGFIFDPSKYEGEIHYARDGNMGFYTKDNEKKRADLKKDMMIEEAINSVMDVYAFERDGKLMKPEYVKVHSCIARILRQDLQDASIQRLIEEDWNHDSKGKGYMDRQEVYDSLFELGDIWSPDIDIFQYVTFFDKLSKILKGQEVMKNNPRSRLCIVAH